MKSLFFLENGNYRKNLIVFLLLTSLPGIILGITLYLVSKTQMENEMQNVHEQHVNNTMETIVDQFSYLELLLAHWAFDSNFYESYDQIDVVFDYQEIHKIYRTLLIMEGSNPLIDQIELYVNNPSEMIFTKNGYVFLDGTKQQHYTELLANDKPLFWNQSFPNVDQSTLDDSGTFGLIHLIPGGAADPLGSLVVYLNKSKLADLVKSPYDDGTVFLFRNQKHWVFDNDRQVQPTAMQRSLYDEISKETKSNSFQFQWDNQTYSVTYKSFSRLNETWYYVSAAPLTAITQPVVFISKMFIVLCVGMLTLAIILSLFASRKLYSPIDRLLLKMHGQKPANVKNEFELMESRWNTLSTDSQNLQNKLEKQLPYLREGFLLQLIQGYLYHYSEKEIQERIEHLGWEVKDKNYVVLFIQLFGFQKQEGRFSDEDEGLVTIVAANLIEELLSRSDLQGNVLNFHDLSLGLLLTVEKDQAFENINNNVVKLSEDIMTHINENAYMDVSISISRMTDSIKAVHTLFEDSKVSLSYRNHQENNQIIEIEKMEGLLNNRQSFDYPFDLEKEITHAIRLRNEEEATKWLKHFFDTLSQNNVSEAMFKQGSFQLLGSIFHVVLQSGLVDEFGNEGASFYEQLSQIREPDKMYDWFEVKIILPVISQLSQKQDQRIRLLVEKVAVLLNEQYMDDISLDYCADYIKMNPTVLSKVFKEITGWNFIDYLTNIRLEKAKELLIETDMKINCIAEKIGYKHSYFNRLFKKHEGTTPGQFRELNRKKIV
jgi:AraC-like DNA-binding protein